MPMMLAEGLGVQALTANNPMTPKPNLAGNARNWKQWPSG